MRQVVVGAFLIAFCFAQGKPNLSGEWKMNRARSSWGLWGEPPDEMTVGVSHKESAIRIEIAAVMNYQRRVQKYAVNGNECTFNAGSETTDCAAEWNGPILVITRKVPSKDGKTGKPTETVWKVRWTVSDDGKVLTMVSRPEEFASTNFDQRAVLEKQ